MAETKTPETLARLRYHRASPTKVRQVLRPRSCGKNVADAREMLRFCERGAGRDGDEAARLGGRQRRAQRQHPDDELFVVARVRRRGPDA